MKKFVLFISVLLFTDLITPQILITGSEIYTQDFNTLTSGGASTVLPIGWFFLESGTSANSTYTASSGIVSAGDTYSYGFTVERSFGCIRSSFLFPIIGAKFQNNTGTLITELSVNYIGEQWRVGATGREDRLDFQYSLNATNLNTGTWVDINQLDFIAPITSGLIGYRDGNLIENRTPKHFNITGLSIPDGSTFWFRWSDFDAAGSDDGLAIDDFSIGNIPFSVELTSFSATTIGKDVKLSWNTATEINNYGFEVERNTPLNPLSRGEAEGWGVWEKIGFVNGNGNSNSPKNYSFVDDKVNAGKYSYRLKQIDNDGQFEYSKTIEVDVNGVKKYELTQNYPNPFNPTTSIQYAISSKQFVTLKVYNLLGREVATLVNENKEAGSYEINFNASKLPSGVYLYKLQAGEFIQTKKMTLVK
ncbi:MAG: T9SS type A sorting domain-containing protein [Ignavibacteriaceae bacterium]